MAKESEGIASLTGSSRDLQGKSSKPEGTLNENWEEMNLKAGKHNQTMSHRRGDVQYDG